MFGVWSLETGVWGLGFGIWDLGFGFGAWGLESGVEDGGHVEGSESSLDALKLRLDVISSIQILSV